MLSEVQVVTMQKTIIRKDDQYAPSFFQAMSDITRLRIVRILAESRGEDICLTDLARILECSLPATSQHMRILEQAQVVEKQRHGKMTCYQLNFSQPFVKGIVSLMKKNN